MCLAGCSTCKPVVVERVVNKTDTLYNASWRVDTFRIHDSVYVETYSMGDTVYKTRVEWRWRDRISSRADTVYKTALRCDSVQVSVPVEHKTTLRGIFYRVLGEALVIVAYVVLLFSLMAYVYRKMNKS
jgi:hypothetical protein